MTTSRFDIHEHITTQIITAIEQGVGDFQLPWRHAGQISRPRNVRTKQAYRGVNILALWAAAYSFGYTSATWGTYRQWAETGAQVRKGEKASYVVFYKELEFAREDAADAETETRLFARATPVFAAEQVDGFKTELAGNDREVEPIAAAESFVMAAGATINHGGDRAYYRPSTDSIQLPERHAFVGSATSTPQEAYYSTLLHELTHWTAPEHRCDRTLGKRFGDDAYAMEELVAELGAAFLCADLGITAAPRLDHAQYIASWLKVLKADKKAIFNAAGAASKAVAFLGGSG
ncbi:zincin-like metallopeptidase domain-containing protein [Phenylobacterium sp.]|jgi:antirestriction protein ArdC|uniref:ArdC family protein n=1 Tax=Phenylobacterium sp. TaxID=1871053 RepID=UPI000C98E56C|nr:zincin-like metallopeptidase domain-containing protein [Phenylobacterium sp.]MAK82392.1 peptidase [Phenylobacterium sp.]|tara:strand:- start:9974 stop:10846 length:873 start_codon:yes stop_codon:yes gene_type:complete